MGTLDSQAVHTKPLIRRVASSNGSLLSGMTHSVGRSPLTRTAATALDFARAGRAQPGAMWLSEKTGQDAHPQTVRKLWAGAMLLPP